jgi:hypothetical protein
MLLRLMRPASPLLLFFWKHVPPAVVAPHTSSSLLLHPCILLPVQLHARVREETQHAYPNMREIRARTPQCERDPSYMQERDHNARAPMQENNTRAPMRGREHNVHAHVLPAACSTVGPRLMVQGRLVQCVLARESKRVGE